LAHIYPGKYGQVYDYADFIKKSSNEIKAAADILSLLNLILQVKWDAVVVTTQRFGIQWVGGPRRLFATKEDYKRSMPGRIIVYHKMLMVIVPYVWHYKHANNT
jgi:glycine dehydrogenase